MRGYPSRRKLFLEQLESRQLLAANVGPSLDAGILTVMGTNKNDSVFVSVSGTDLTVTVNKQSFTFNSADVTEIDIDGGRGNDQIWVDDAVTANSVLHGGDGNDRVHGGGGNDTITGDKGNDRISGGSGNDSLSGGVGNDWVWGDAGDDIAHGDAGNDHVLGGADNDQLFGDAGHDALDGGDGDDILDGGDNKDHLNGGAGNDQLFGQGDKDLLWGGDGDDQLFGGSDNDHLWGGAGNDDLKAGAGNDQLDGGTGDNLLDGDTGHDHYKNGFVVDLDQSLTVEMTNADGVVAVATFGFVVENGAVVQKLVITVDNVPTDGVTPVDLPVTINSMSVGSITVDPVTGHGSLTFTTSTTPGPDELAFPAGLSLSAGSTIEIGSDLTGTFVAAFA